MKLLSETRAYKINRAIAHKQPNITLVFDNVLDPHNIFAAMRTADSVGLIEVYSIHTGEVFTKKYKEGKRSGSSSKKWIINHQYNNYEACFEAVKKKYDLIFGTALGEHSVDLYEMDLKQSIALVFGNERTGLSEEAKKYCDGHFLIPQVGMIESLNISVACAVTLYEAYRQRKVAGMYDEKSLFTNEMRENMLEIWREM